MGSYRFKHQSKPKGRLLVVGVKSYGGPKHVLPKPTRPPLRQLDAADVNMQTPRARQGGNGALPVGEHAPHAGLGQGGLDDDGDGSVDGDPPDGEQARDPHDGEQECLRCGQVNEPDVADCYYCKNPFPAPGADNNDGFFAPQPTGGKGRGSTVQHAEDRAQQLQTLRSEATMVRSLMNVGGLDCLRPQAIWIANELAKGKSIGGGSDGSGGLEHNELFKEDSGMLREGAGELKVCPYVTLNDANSTAPPTTRQTNVSSVLMDSEDIQDGPKWHEPAASGGEMPNDLFPMGEGGSVGNGQKGIFFHGTKNGRRTCIKVQPHRNRSSTTRHRKSFPYLPYSWAVLRWHARGRRIARPH